MVPGRARIGRTLGGVGATFDQAARFAVNRVCSQFDDGRVGTATVEVAVENLVLAGYEGYLGVSRELADDGLVARGGQFVRDVARQQLRAAAP